MSPKIQSPIEIQIYSAPSIGQEPFWPQLLEMINGAYEATRENWPLPKNFYRLPPDPAEGAEHVVKIFGQSGFVAVVFITDSDSKQQPVACVGAMPFEEAKFRKMLADVRAMSKPPILADVAPPEGVDIKENTTKNSGSPTSHGDAWDYNMVMTHRDYRGKGLSSALLKATEDEVRRRRTSPKNIRLVAGTIDEISGGFWRSRGFEAIEDGELWLPAGFTHLNGRNGLLRKLMLWYGEKYID